MKTFMHHYEAFEWETIHGADVFFANSAKDGMENC